MTRSNRGRLAELNPGRDPGFFDAGYTPLERPHEAEVKRMIEFRTGDILQDDAEALVNTVNCIGVMGRGLAKQFKDAFPPNFKAYATACERGEVRPGRMFVHDTGQITPPHFIINFPTKRHWRERSRMEDIETGLAALVDVIRERRIRSVAVPPLGCGLGGLDWNEVRPRIEEALAGLHGVRVTVYEPEGVSGAAGPASGRPGLAASFHAVGGETIRRRMG